MVATEKSRYFIDPASLDVKWHFDEDEWVKLTFCTRLISCSTSLMLTDCMYIHDLYMYIRCGRRKEIQFSTLRSVVCSTQTESVFI